MFELIGNLFSSGLNYLTGKQNQDTQMQIANQNIALQKEFAQSGIQWKVADAQKAGIHPLAALGANTTSFSPVSVGSTDFGNMGQDLGRAIKAAGGLVERENQDVDEAKALTLERGKLENDLIRQQILNSKIVRHSQGSGQLGPPMPSTVDRGRIPLPRSGPERTVSGLAVAGDDLKQKEQDHPGLKTTRPFGYELYTNPYFSDGQSFEDRYGDSEIGGTLKTGTNLVADHLYTGYKKLVEPYWLGPSVSRRPRARRSSRPWGE